MDVGRGDGDEVGFGVGVGVFVFVGAGRGVALGMITGEAVDVGEDAAVAGFPCCTAVTANRDRPGEMAS